MFSSIAWPTWNDCFQGDVTFKQVGEIISSMFSELFENEIFREIGGFFSSALQSLALPVFAVLAALSVIFALRGRKLLPAAKFVGFFFIGFVFGAAYIEPLLFGASTGILPPLVGGAVGFIGALLSKPLYLVLYIASFACSAYMIFMGGQLLPESIANITRGNMIIALVAVCITVVVVFLLRKQIEIIGTAVLGGYLFSLCIDKVLYAAFGLERIKALSIALMVVVAILGIYKQFKSRKGKNIMRKREKKIKTTKKIAKKKK